MKPITAWLTLALSLPVLTLPAEAADPVGVRTLSVPAPERGVNLGVTLWYPALEDGMPLLFGDNPVFRGTQARQGASLMEGRFPLVVLSHGLGGSALSFSWIASSLAAQGFIVAAPNHPGSTTGDISPAEAIKIWHRPSDMSALLTTLTTHPDLAQRIDDKKIGVLGFSLGGQTALALAGARTDLGAYGQYCRNNKEPDSECPWFLKGGVDFSSVDAALFSRSGRDVRLKVVIAVDPGFAQAFTLASLNDISVPVHIINLGQRGRIPLKVSASHLVATIPGAEYSTVPDATHFSFSNECKPNASAMLKDDGEDLPICEDGGGRSRSDIHADLARLIVTTFARRFQMAQ
jgi:predicted dienelactone hydrolase